MSTCIRNGVRFKRHNMNATECIYCGMEWESNSNTNEVINDGTSNILQQQNTSKTEAQSSNDTGNESN